MDRYSVALLTYLLLAAASFVPVAQALVRKVQPLLPGGPGFDHADQFSEEARARLTQHYQRLHGTLMFWKNQATKYKRFHNYSIVWVGIATASVPLLAQTVTVAAAGRWLITVVGLHAALCLTFSRAFRVESNYRAFRHGESEFYDLYRRLLDQPATFGRTESRQLASYFQQVEVLRRYIRGAETDNLPSIEEVSHAGREGKQAGSTASPDAT